jgi:serine-type D-Ala-D-Ala carboxypeptidase/endopeptidase
VLADMVERREVKLTDPAAAYLPREVRMPERNGQVITLQDLATHRSGLPRMPSNVDPTDPANPYADYPVHRLYAFLSSYQLSRNIDSRFEYSNLGGALLGHVLARRAGVDYETLVETRVTKPLQMANTRVALTDEMKSRLAVGHAYGLEPTSNWDLGALVAAGGLHSTANDLLTLLSAHLRYTETPLASAMASMMDVRRDTGRGEVALAWFVESPAGSRIVFHDGSMGGYRCFIAFDPQARTGVVVLSNSGAGAGIDDIALHVLNANVPLRDARDLAPPKTRTQVPIDSEILDAYTGRYRFVSSQMATVSRNGSHLYLEAEGDVKLAFYPESSEQFFAKIMDAQITFVRDSGGHVTELLFHRNGATQRVQRVD